MKDHRIEVNARQIRTVFPIGPLGEKRQMKGFSDTDIVIKH